LTVVLYLSPRRCADRSAKARVERGGNGTNFGRKRTRHSKGAIDLGRATGKREHGQKAIWEQPHRLNDHGFCFSSYTSIHTPTRPRRETKSPTLSRQ
jgi:hypothetical protein